MKALVKVVAVIALVCLLNAKSASAGPLTIYSDTSSSTEGLGEFTGTFAYDAALAKLSITLQHTSPLMGYLTGLAFLNPGGKITGVSMTSSDSDFVTIGGSSYSGGISGSPFGDFDIGASIASSWLGSGNPTRGVESGDSVSFTFAFTGIGLGGLSEMDFVDAAGPGGEFFVVRFRGFDEPPTAGSDKVPADYSTVPEPASILLLGSAVALLVPRFRRAVR